MIDLHPGALYHVTTPRGMSYTGGRYLGCRNGRYYFGLGEGVRLVLDEWVLDKSEFIEVEAPRAEVPA